MTLALPLALTNYLGTSTTCVCCDPSCCKVQCLKPVERYFFMQEVPSGNDVMVIGLRVGVGVLLEVQVGIGKGLWIQLRHGHPSSIANVR